MSHLNEALLRRYIDEPDALLSYEKEHLLQCASCHANLDRLREHATFAANMLATQGGVDLQTAHNRILERASAGGAPTVEPIRVRTVPSRLVQWSAAIAAGLALLILVGYTPLRGYAQNFLAIFEPHQFQPIGVSAADISKMQGLPNLQAFGTMRETGSSQFVRFGSDAAAAARYAHQPILRAHYLPPGLPASATYHVSGTHSVQFTFSAAKARTMPANIDGSTLSATIGPVVIQSYGVNTNEFDKHLADHKRGSGASHAHHLHSLPADMVIVTQAPTPRVYSTGATVVQIESWLLAQPGLPANLVQQIRAIGDPTTTLPVPVQLDKQNAQTVRVQNAAGLLIGDNTGVGSVIFWQKNGMVYAVAGPYAASQIMQVANSLAL